MEYEVWYMRPEWFPQGIFGAQPNPADLSATHIHLTNVEMIASSTPAELEGIFKRMQGEVWSPNGEARELILGKGLRHTSMSVGDVVVSQEDGRTWVVAAYGFDELKNG